MTSILCWDYKCETRNVLNINANFNSVPQHVYNPNFMTDKFSTVMERRCITNPCACFPNLAMMFYPDFTQTQPIQLETQPWPRRENENIQPIPEEMWYTNQSISTPQNYRRNCLFLSQMSTGLFGMDPTSTPIECTNSSNAHNEMYYTPCDIRKGHNSAIQVPDHTLSNLNRLEMFTQKAIGEIYSSIPGEKSATGCKGIHATPNNHGVGKFWSNNDLALDRKISAIKEDALHEVSGARGYKRKVHLVPQENSSNKDLMENRSIKRICRTVFLTDVCDLRPTKADEDENYIDVETVDDDDVEKDGTVDDPDETIYIDVVGLSDDEQNQSLEKS